MFPLRDNIQSRYTPYAARIIIGLNTLVYLFGLTLPKQEMVKIFYLLGVVPGRYAHPAWAEWMGYPETGFMPFITHMFLHSGFLHFISNMWILWVFADNVEDVMGPFRFAVFYILCGLVALVGHMIFNLHSAVPVIGASGAIAGVMGAYLILYPRAKVLTLVPIFIFPFFFDLPALLFLGLWFFIQIFSGLASSVSSQGVSGVAWWAHAFGFIAGFALLPIFRNKKRCPDCAQKFFKDNDDFFFD